MRLKFSHTIYIIIMAHICAPVLIYPQAKKGNNKAASIAPEFEKGWYLPLKGDTIKGEIQTNAGETDAQYNFGFYFKSPKSPKATEITSKKAKAFGFGDRKFELIKLKETEYFAEVLEKGRIILYQIHEEKTENGQKIAIPFYYIIDTQADPKSKLASLTELPKEKPYKKVLKELFKDQAMLIENVDKWFLQIDQVRPAIQEFNKLYSNTPSSPATDNSKPGNKKQENSEEIEVEKVD